LFEPLDVVLLPERCNPLWAELLRERCGLYQRHQGLVRLSGGENPMWERRESHLLRSRTGVRIGMPVGGLVQHGLGLRQRHDVDDDHDTADDLVLVDFDLHEHEHEHDNDDYSGVHGRATTV
jgi:hypothetical protein